MLSVFGRKVENEQIRQGINHSDLAKRAGISRQNLYRIKRSKRPQIRSIYIIAKALGVPVDIFFIGN